MNEVRLNISLNNRSKIIGDLPYAFYLSLSLHLKLAASNMVNDFVKKNKKQKKRQILLSFTGMLEGWQGWWTSAKYYNGINEFAWKMPNKLIEFDDPNWGFKKEPYEDTCVWVLQISVYNYTWGNYDCFTQSGFVCEIELP